MKTFDPERLPLLMAVRDAMAVSGLGRSEIYNRLATGELRARKMRRSTLIETQSLLDNLAALPIYGQRAAK